jgi:sulfatase maturation enzyme AslB (radical SAM superfamily)
VLPGDFHPITAYLFVEYKCNLDCWYCPSYDNSVKGMSEDIARRSIEKLGTPAEEAVRVRLHDLLQYQYLPQQP